MPEVRFPDAGCGGKNTLRVKNRRWGSSTWVHPKIVILLKRRFPKMGVPNSWMVYSGTSRRVGNGPSKNSIFMWLARSQSCVSQFFFMFLCCPWRSVNSIVILNFHWDLLYIVDMSECKNGSFWEVSVPKTSAAAIFSGDLYRSSLSTHLFSTTGLFQLHLHDVCAHVQVNVPWRNIMGGRKYVNVIAPPHPTPRNI